MLDGGFGPNRKPKKSRPGWHWEWREECPCSSAAQCLWYPDCKGKGIMGRHWLSIKDTENDNATD